MSFFQTLKITLMRIKKMIIREKIKNKTKEW